MSKLIIAFLALTILFVNVRADESVDHEMISKIRDEGFNRSGVMESLRMLTDEIGPRLTASPGMRAASKWTVEQLEAWGIDNVYLEGFEFGRGWSMTRSEIHMTTPRHVQLHGLPIAWHPGTDGLIEGEIIYAPISSSEDFEQWRGQLEGKFVLISQVSEATEYTDKITASYTDAELEERSTYKIPVGPPPSRSKWAERISFRYELSTFLVEQGALGVIRKNYRDDMAISNDGYQYKVGQTPQIPGVVLATQYYKRLKRLADNGHVVRLSMDIDVEFHDDDHQGYSTIAEIPGEGRSPEIVMAGAHIDSVPSGDGAADNAAGVSVVMEAMRILKALNVQPKRSIRIGLWSGEETEYYGSAKHVSNNFGHFPRLTGDIYNNVGDYESADLSKPFTKERDYDKFSVYFNIDNGAGKFRGIYTQGNAAVRPIFEDWLAPFHDLGATHVTLNSTANTDHEPFQLIGLPGFQFIQDRSGGNRGYHNQLDLYDERMEKDLKQASVILASFLYHAAMRDERMPRKSEPLPVINNN
ncbi:MAG: M20/M25/M40 family metallo-hydrolase [Woeseiaceae bacterium]